MKPGDYAKGRLPGMLPADNRDEGQPMKPGPAWLITAFVGATASLTTSLGLLALLLYMLATTPLIFRWGLVALSGLLTGFGAFWLFLMARSLADGGKMDSAAFWVAVGAVPLGVGLALLLLILARRPVDPEASGGV
jgi:hypothetical protein